MAVLLLSSAFQAVMTAVGVNNKKGYCVMRSLVLEAAIILLWQVEVERFLVFAMYKLMQF